MESRLQVLIDSSRLLNKTLKYSADLIKSFKQISVDQITNDIRSIDIQQYINEIFLTNHNRLKILPVEVNITSNKDEIIINTSAGIFGQVFNNLIQNSIIHGFENIQKKAVINVDLIKEDEKLIIIYEDNGLGIEESIKDRIYEPFVTTKRNSGGTGLGLNIVYNLITQKLKGTLHLESTRNIGTKFIITIPNTNLDQGKI